MPEPTSSTAAVALTASGISLWGVATGIHPIILVAGVAGGWLAMTYLPSVSTWRRLSLAALSGLIAAWATPATVAGLRSLSIWPEPISVDMAQYPVAIVLGLLAWRVIGPRLIDYAEKKSQEVARWKA